MTRPWAVAFAAVVFACAASAADFARVTPVVTAGAFSAPAAAAASLVRPLAALPSALTPLAMSPLAAAPALAAPAPLPVPVAAPALNAAPAAMEAPQAPKDAPGASAPQSGEEEAVRAAARFDGGAAAPASDDAPVVVQPAPAYRPGDGLRVADPADQSWLDELVATLARSKTGRRVLRDIAALERARGNPTLVVVKPIGNNGEFRYDSDLLVMDAAHLKRAPEQVAPIFAHELQHVLQRALHLPADALELEVESYTVENRVWSELGVTPGKDTFAIQARRSLLKDTDGFVEWLGEQYKNNRAIHGKTMDSYVDWLRKKRANLMRRVARAQKELEKANMVAAAMRAEGKPEEAVRSFTQDDIEPVERRLRDMSVEKDWLDGDLKILSTKEGRDRFRAYSRGVIRRARALSRT